MLHCHYKAWQLSKNSSLEVNIHDQPNIASDSSIIEISKPLSSESKIVLTVLAYQFSLITQQKISRIQTVCNNKVSTLTLKPDAKKVQSLLQDAKSVLESETSPPFYKNQHCPECIFRETCYKQLKERDCISLLAGMTSKVIARFQKKGVYTVTQLSHLFRPRRRRKQLHISSNYLWELKALAITEKKTFVLNPPNIPASRVSIYWDFEGLPDENYIYLVGVYITQDGQNEIYHSFWADSKENEKDIFIQLFDLLRQYPDALIFYYSSYETKALKQIAKRWPQLFKAELERIEPNLINLLSFLRTHVYPPIYSNGLKELARFLSFKWENESIDGLRSINWRKDWEINKSEVNKDSLIQYNKDDCKALSVVRNWFDRLFTGSEIEEQVQQVSEMKKLSPYKFHNNPELGDDFQFISKAAYFDYQRSKIYWRNKKKPVLDPPEHKASSQKGVMVWQPKTVNETIVLPPLKRCPRCGTQKVYQYKKKITLRQTDLKFTSKGIKQHVIEYQATRAKCGKCYLQYNNHSLRRFRYGNNLFAYATNLYISYNISNYMISKIILEQFGIWISPMYLVMRKEKWWQRWNSEVDYVWKTILNSPVIHIDETAINLENKSGYVWVFATTQTVFYHYTDTREAGFLHEWLRDYKGIIVTDFFPSYESLAVKRQKCLIHLIRDLNDDLFKNPFDEEYKHFVIGFNTLLRKIIETIDKYGLKKKHLVKHLKDVGLFYDHYLQKSSTSELSAKYVKRFRKHWEQLWVFLSNDSIPWNNNNAEAAIKAFAQYRRGVKGQIGEHGLREYLKMLSIAQTCRYRNISFLSFLRGKAGIWDNIHPGQLPGYLPFAQAKLFVHKLKFQRRVEWLAWVRSSKRPHFIPQSPDRVYKNQGWVNWADWLGFGFLPFEKARTCMRKLGLSNRLEYREWLKSGKRPKNIPHEPEKIYKSTGWAGLGDYLGTGNQKRQKIQMLSYEQAKSYVQALGINTWNEYRLWSKSGERPNIIPSSPNTAYPEFISWGEFLGTHKIANQKKEFWSYQETKRFLATMNIKSKSQFVELCKKKTMPVEIPRDPMTHYKRIGGWISYSDLFGKRK